MFGYILHINQGSRPKCPIAAADSATVRLGTRELASQAARRQGAGGPGKRPGKGTQGSGQKKAQEAPRRGPRSRPRSQQEARERAQEGALRRGARRGFQ